mmetsp:Transcript_43562/g.115012  ORF Transcript_43562/g.115012 Transcript_43562/m.115012 type:complete len:89 (-) Transcript_43562:197-463(-)
MRNIMETTRSLTVTIEGVEKATTGSGSIEAAVGSVGDATVQGQTRSIKSTRYTSNHERKRLALRPPSRSALCCRSVFLKTMKISRGHT